MIIYFADRLMNILGQATSSLPKGLSIIKDLKTADVETGVSSFECVLPFNAETRENLVECSEVGNYILRSNNSENEIFTIIDAEIDEKKQEILIYAEDAGLDLLNEVVGEYAADKAYDIAFYINKFTYDSGFEIGINEIKGLTRKLSWDGEATVTERVASVATQFDNAEISYSFEIKGLKVVKKYINIYKKRGSDNGVQLRLGKEIDNIIITKSIANLATALVVTGGTPEEAENPITLNGYKYDDGDFYVQNGKLYSREALKKWSRYIWSNEPNQLKNGLGHIVKTYSYDTTNQSTLCKRAITELKKLREVEVNYQAEILKLPDNVKVGDRVNVINDAGGLYLSTRILQLETSVADDTVNATLGEYLIKGSGISQKVMELATQFAKTSQSATRALSIATVAKTNAEAAQEQAQQVVAEIATANQAADEAKTAATTATQSAVEANEKADAATAKVETVEASVQSLETTVENAQTAANNAHHAAETAQSKADEAKQAASSAVADAAVAKARAEETDEKAELAISKANEAISTAGTATEQATQAKETATAAKADAEKAKTDIQEWADNLETYKQTVSADYARKTDLTEATANLQTQITQNAAEISSTATKVQSIDETANDAKEQAEAAKTTATAAQTKADQATADAEAAQTKADEAKTAAENAQAEADNAKNAAATAQSVADKAEADLKAARADLETVTSRIDATEEEIAAAQQAVEVAQTAADKAKTDALAATEKATTAQNTANTAATNAADAQTVANNAASQAALAQQVANEAKGNAETAQQVANEAAETAAEAQRTASTAVTDAANAQAKADEATANAITAQTKANEADAKAQQAATDLETAKQNLVNVEAKADATAEEVETAKQAVETAQAAADKAKADATTAQNIANTAAQNAATAQSKANEAKQAADNAQQAATEAQKAADDAQAAVDALAVRVTTAETNITQNAEKIALAATKKEVSTTLGGYYNKAETDAKFEVTSEEISSVVERVDTNSENITIAESEIKQLSDSISMLVTDGNGSSLMTQTENGWTFSTSKIQSDINSVSENIGTIQDQLGSTEATVEVLQQAVSDIGAKTDYVNISTYTYTNESGETLTEPCIELGESDNDYKLLITNTQILFKAGSAIPTRIDTEGLVTESITIENELRHTHPAVNGFYVWAMDSDGSYGLQWKGAE